MLKHKCIAEKQQTKCRINHSTIEFTTSEKLTTRKYWSQRKRYGRKGNHIDKMVSQ